MVKRHWKLFFIGLLLCADLLAMSAAAASAVLLHRASGFDILTMRTELESGMVIFVVGYIVFCAMSGYYRGSSHLPRRTRFGLAAKAYLMSIIVLLPAISVFLDVIIDRRVLVPFLLFFPLYFLCIQALVQRLNIRFRKKGYGLHPSLIAGFNPESQFINDHFSLLPELGYSVCGFIVNEKERPHAETFHPGYTLQEVEEVIVRKGIDRIFISSTDHVANGYSSLQTISRRYGIKLKVLSPQAGELLKYAKVYDIAGITLTSPPRYKIDRVRRALKRTFDILGSAFLLVLLSPIFMLTCAAIWAVNGRPIFFTQSREAVKNGPIFQLIKFRTMIRHADDMQELFDTMNPSVGELFKMKHDPRVTSIGRFLRKSSIDELPQLINVLKGDMSLVGPRPIPPGEIDKMNMPDNFWEAVKDRALVKPGMTGIWQVSGRSDIKFKEMILLDLYYVENYSLMFDLEILFETIPVVLFGKGAY